MAGEERGWAMAEAGEKPSPPSSSPPDAPKRVSCTKFFDALGFCYSPVHQMQQYYRLGGFDNCFSKWNDLFDCLNLKTKRSSEAQEILAAREKSRTHIWSFRTVDEASVHWKELFGHVNEDQ